MTTYLSSVTRKRDSALALVREVAAANNNEFAHNITHHERIYNQYKSFDDPVMDIKGMLFAHDDEELTKWTEYFTPILNHITSNEVAFLVDYMANCCHRRMLTLHQSEAKLSLPLMRPNNKTTGFDLNFFRNSCSCCTVTTSAHS